MITYKFTEVVNFISKYSSQSQVESAFHLLSVCFEKFDITKLESLNLIIKKTSVA